MPKDKRIKAYNAVCEKSCAAFLFVTETAGLVGDDDVSLIICLYMLNKYSLKAVI